MDKEIIEKLEARDACGPALEWLEKQPDANTAWATCEKLNWMAWIMEYFPSRKVHNCLDQLESNIHKIALQQVGEMRIEKKDYTIVSFYSYKINYSHFQFVAAKDEPDRLMWFSNEIILISHFVELFGLTGKEVLDEIRKFIPDYEIV